MASTSTRRTSMRIMESHQLPSQQDENAMPATSCSTQAAMTASPLATIGQVRSPSKMPTLSDIAARLNRDKDSNNGSGSPIKQQRLELTGRITASPQSLQSDGRKGMMLSASPTKVPSSDSEQRAVLPVSPSKGSSSRTSSPTKRLLAKGLPSLEEIQDRMAKKGLPTGRDETSPPFVSSPSSPTKLPTVESQTKCHEIKEPQSPVQARNLQPPKVEQNLPPTDAGKPALRVSTRSPSLAPTVKLNHPLPPSPALSRPSHPLQHEWTLFFDTRSAGAPSTPILAPNASPLSLPPTPTQTASTWEANLRTIGAYSSVETFLSCFSKLRRPSQLDRHSSYHCFKDGIKPMWEDLRNAQGGKWTLTFRQRHPALVDRSWLWLVLGLIGEEMDDADETCGAVCSVKPRGDRISLWVRDRSDVEKVNRIGRKLISVLEVESEPGILLEFSAHSDRSDEVKLEGLYTLSNPVQTVKTPTLNAFGDSAKLSPGLVAKPGNSPTSPQFKPFVHSSTSPNPASLTEPYSRLNGQHQSTAGAGCMFGNRPPANSCTNTTAGAPAPAPTPAAFGALGQSLGLGNTSPRAQDGKASRPPLPQQASEGAFSWRSNGLNRTTSPQRRNGEATRSRSTSPFKA